MQPYPDISIIVLTYNRSDLIDQRLSELNRLPLATHNAEVVVFDNGSTDGTPLILATARTSYSTRGKRLISARTAENLGFAGGFNQAVRAAAGDILVLLSNDVRVVGDFLPAIRDELASPDGRRRIVAHEIVRHSAGWNVFGEVVFPWPAGYFLAMRKETWDLLGGFDTAFHPNDYEDVDIGYRARQDGFEIVERRDLPVEHMVAQTIGYSPERYEQTVRMRALFAAKHGLENRPERP